GVWGRWRGGGRPPAAWPARWGWLVPRGRTHPGRRTRHSTTSRTRPKAGQAAHALPFPFTWTARVGNFLRGTPNLADTLKRLQAFEQAGADVLFAPGLPDLTAVRPVGAAVSKPVNFMVGIPGKSFTVAERAAAGVRRISLATSLHRAAMRGLPHAARKVQDKGTFGYLDHALTIPALNDFLQG